MSEENLRSGADLIRDLAKKYNIEVEVLECIVHELLSEITRSMGRGEFTLNVNWEENDVEA